MIFKLVFLKGKYGMKRFRQILAPILSAVLIIGTATPGFALSPVDLSVTVKDFGGSLTDEFDGVALAADGGYAAVGFSYSNDGDFNSLQKGSNKDAIIMKLDANGNLGWVKDMGGSDQDQFTAVTRTQDNGFAAAGLTFSNNGDFPGLKGQEDGIIVKFDNCGNVQWKKNIGGTNYDYFNAITACPDGGVVAAMDSSSNDDLKNLHIGCYDAVVVKLNSAGKLQWIKDINGSCPQLVNTSFQSIQCTTDNGYIAAGYSSATNSCFAGKNYGGTDAIFAKLDLNGNVQWIKNIGGSGCDEFYTVSQDADGNYFAAGYSASTDHDLQGITKGGKNDAIAVKLGSNGTKLWLSDIGGTENDSFLAGTVNSDGGYTVVGDISDGATGALSGLNKGKYDADIVRYDTNGNVLWAKDFAGSSTELFTSVLAVSPTRITAVGTSSSNDGTFSGLNKSGQSSDNNGDAVFVSAPDSAEGPTINAPSNVIFYRSAPGTYSLSASGGVGTLIWSAIGLPTGISINSSTGEISGTTTDHAGAYSVNITVKDCMGASSSIVLPLTVSEPCYSLSVNLGDGSGRSYLAGTVIDINSGTKSGSTFAGWGSSDGGTLLDATNSETAFTMPDNATTITAGWTANQSYSYVSAPVSHTVIIVDKANYYIGTENVSGNFTTASVDQSELTTEIGKASTGSSVIIPISSNTSITAHLFLKNIIDMANKDMLLTVQSGEVSYSLHAKSIDTAKIISALGSADSGSISFDIGISSSNATVSGATLIVSPVTFTITCTYNGKSTSVDSFSRFEQRSIEVTKAQSNLITTAAVVDADGNLHHVPTKIVIRGGQYFAVISSLTNSTYALIRNTVDFEDIENHWAMDSINDMGARMITAGVSDSVFEPERDMTRAEFASVVVRALGLDKGLGSKSFSDVSPSAWYCGYIQTASGYGIVNGYGDGSFRPENTITREQAMTMIARAAYLTGPIPQLSNDKVYSILSKYSDNCEISACAKENVAVCSEKGLILGRPDGTLAPEAFISRSEVATLVQRLLQNSDLI